VLTLKRDKSAELLSIPIDGQPLEDLLSREWLLTNSRGGYSSSTIIGCNTRKYHGLLIGSLAPPVHRIMALSQCLETLILDPQAAGSDGQNKKQVYNLATFEFEGRIFPKSFNYIDEFRRYLGVHFDYKFPEVELSKSIYLHPESDIVVVVYDFTYLSGPLKFILRPFIGLRNFHTLQKSYAPLYSVDFSDGLLVRHNVPGSCELVLNAPKMKYVKDECWWFDFLYRNEKQRGYEYTEDLWTPGFYNCVVDSPTQIIFHAGLYGPGDSKGDFRAKTNIEKIKQDLSKKQKSAMESVNTKDENLQELFLAADQFIVKRQTENTSETTIVAGFPWFSDLGRDAFLSLPGLMLENGRYKEAKSLLSYFAQAVDKGMIPNRFDEHNHKSYFNSVDGSLWFINAAFQYLNKTADFRTFSQDFLPAIRWIVDSYNKGTRFGIHADKDGLITAGDENTQLTWMDAKYAGATFPPRFGKAVEVNALWYNALRWLVDLYAARDKAAQKSYKSLADKVESSFREVFWNESAGYLNDCIFPDGSVDAALRPNQIFAVSLAFSPLTDEQKKAVVNIIEEKLLTPFGLRTLDPSDKRYKGTCTGSQKERDQAYYQGTVWPYLIGAFVEGYLKVNHFSKRSKRNAAGFIQPLIRSLTQDGCVGNLSEICDGDKPYHPRGCIAQAWNVAELIRAYRLVKS